MKLPTDRQYGTILADPPWRFAHRTGKVAPEHGRTGRYATMRLEDIMALPVPLLSLYKSHLYLWTPNALMPDALQVMKRWGFTYKTTITWFKVRADGGPDRRGVGFYYRNVTEQLLFGVRGRLRTLAPARSMPNAIVSRKRGHSRKPDEQYPMIEACSPGPFIELFARGTRPGWTGWGDQAEHVWEGPTDADARGTGADADVRADEIGSGDQGGPG